MASILLASQGQLTIACGLVFLAAVFDVFDGLAARALGEGSPLGAQLDSLADLVSFGVAPGFIAFALVDWTSASSIKGLLIAKQWPMQIGGGSRSITSGPPLMFQFMAPLLIVVPSAWRLAKFNLDTRQSSGFLGLPTPANGLFWASVPLALGTGLVREGPGAAILQSYLFDLADPARTSAVALVLGILMLSELPLPSLKFKHKGWKGNEVIFLLIGIGAALVLLYGVLAVPLILIIYLLSPLWGKLFPKAH